MSGNGLGDDECLQLGTAKYARQFVITFWLVQPEATSGVEGEHKGDAMLLEHGQIVDGVIEEIEVGQATANQPGRREGLNPGSVLRVALCVVAVLLGKITQVGENRELRKCTKVGVVFRNTKTGQQIVLNRPA